MILEARGLLYLLLSFSFTRAIVIQQRQFTPDLLGQYTTQIKTAIYVLDNLQADNATNSCADTNLVNSLNTSGYDGDYAQRLLCESAIGIRIFSDLNQAAVAMHNALGALNTLQADPSSPTRAACQGVRVETLDEAGLDGLGIYNAVCNLSISTLSTVATVPRSGLVSNTSRMPGLPGTSFTPTTSSRSIAPSQPESASSIASNTLVSSNQTTNTNLLGTSLVSASNVLLMTQLSSRSRTENIHTQPLTSSQLNATPTSVAVVTTFETTWVIGPALSFSSTASTKSGNRTTITHTITSTSTIDIRTTVTVLDPTSSLEASSALRHGPWQWHGPWRPHHHPAWPLTSGRHVTLSSDNRTEVPTSASKV